MVRPNECDVFGHTHFQAVGRFVSKLLPRSFDAKRSASWTGVVARPNLVRRIGKVRLHDLHELDERTALARRDVESLPDRLWPRRGERESRRHILDVREVESLAAAPNDHLFSAHGALEKDLADSAVHVGRTIDR